ncbi:MAG: N-acyl homoserine lactonase family protein [Solirubrobacterales bacterium]
MSPNSSIQIYALHCGGDVCDWSVFDPFDPRVGNKVTDPYFVYVIRHPDGILLFDSGAHPEMATNPESRVGDAAEDFQVVLSPEDHIDRKLATIGLRPEDIDTVIQSHLHFDHAGGLYLFPDTPVMVQRAELEFAKDPPPYQKDIYVREDFAGVQNWHIIEGDHDVFGDERVLVVSTPGHTPGHQSLLVQTNSQVVFLLADAAYFLEKMRVRALPAVLWSPDAYMETWDRIEELEREREAFLIATHDLDFEERVKLAPASWYE